MAKPKRVETEVFEDNQERLSVMGRAGGKARAEQRQKEAREKDVLADIAQTEAERKHKEALEAAAERADHLIPEDDR